MTKSDKSLRVEIDRHATQESSKQRIFDENIAVDGAGQRKYQRVFKQKGTHKVTARLSTGETALLESEYVANNPERRTTVVKINKSGDLSISEMHVDLPGGSGPGGA